MRIDDMFTEPAPLTVVVDRIETVAERTIGHVSVRAGGVHFQATTRLNREELELFDQLAVKIAVRFKPLFQGER